MQRLKELAAEARRELRNPNRDAKLPCTRAFAKHFNKMSRTVDFDGPNKFGREYWVQVARVMGEDTEKVGADLSFWVTCIAWIVCLLTFPSLSALRHKDLERVTLSFFDAVEFVG